jgi:hypothetical protein
MNLAVPITMLIGFLGYNMSSSGKVPRGSDNERKKVSAYDEPSQTNTYRSVYSKKVQNNERNLADIRYEKAKDPINTNIIPPLYNSICNYDCDTNGNPRLVPNTILPSVLPVDQKLDYSSKIQEMTESPMFAPPVIGRAIETTDSASGGFQPIIKEAFTNQTGVSELTGLPIDLNHTNMVPFFKGTGTGQNMNLERHNSTLETFTGTGNNLVKSEIPAMFKPAPQNVFGAQVTQDRTRFVQSNLKTNVLPVPQIMVSPLPADSVRPSYRTQEQLNVNPRITNRPIEPNTGVSQSQTQRGIIGEFRKNKPETTYAIGPERYLPGSTVKGQARRENFSNKECNITETQFNINPAVSRVPAGKTNVYRKGGEQINSLDTLVNTDKRQTDKSFGIRNAKGNSTEIARGCYTANEVQRNTTNRMTLQPAGDRTKSVYHAFTDDAKVTSKQANLFSYTGNAESSVKNPMDYTSDYNYTRKTARINNNDYIGNAKFTSNSRMDETGYENMEIHTNKETIDDLRNYALDIGIGPKLASGACAVNIQNKDDSIWETKDHAFAYNRIVNEIASMCEMGEQETKVNRELLETDMGQRIDPVFIQALNKNPYNIDINRTPVTRL